MVTTVNPRPARRTQRKARLLLWGKSGSGKTLTALKLARGLAGPAGTICVLDTDCQASELYADAHRFDIEAVDPPFEPDRFTAKVKALGPRYDVLVLDTGTHEWMGEGGCLELRDREALRLKDNSWAAWSKVTPVHQRFVEALLRCPAHLIVTLRAKTVTEQARDEKGKPVVVDLGLFPQQRYDGDEFVYGLDIAGRLDPEGQGVRLTITTTRYAAWQGASFVNPDEALGEALAAWLNQGVAPAPETPTPPPAPGDGGREDRGSAAVTPLPSVLPGGGSPASPGVVDDRQGRNGEAPQSRPTGHPPEIPPDEPSRPGPQREDPPPDASRRTTAPTRGALLGAITTELFRLVPGRGDDGRRQRVAVLEETCGAPTMRDVAKLPDEALQEGLRRLQAKTPATPAPQHTARRREREPGEEG